MKQCMLVHLSGNMTRKQCFRVCLFSGMFVFRHVVRVRDTWLRKNISVVIWCVHLQKTWLGNTVSCVVQIQKTWLGNNLSGLSIFQKQVWEIMSPLNFFLFCPGHKKRSEQIKHSYQSLHHVHSSLSHRTHLSKNIDRIDDTFLEFIKNCIYGKEDASSTNTSTRILIDRIITNI